MPALNSYDYAIVRVVPCVERGEYINAGVILFCRTRRFLDALIYLDIQRLTTLYPAVDLDMVSGRHRSALAIRAFPLARLSTQHHHPDLARPLGPQY